MPEEREERRAPVASGQLFSQLLSGLTGGQRAGALAVVLAGSGLGVGGIVQFVTEAPGVVEANAQEIRMHHDTLVVHSSLIPTIMNRLQEIDTGNQSRDRKLDFLVCLELEEGATVRVCSQALTN